MSAYRLETIRDCGFAQPRPTSYLSSRSRFRSGLRSISRRDIEDHPVFDPHRLIFKKRSFRIRLWTVPYLIVNMMFCPSGGIG